ncbi:hypothetical protein V6N13_105939 [Hibiscus sabdariffa]
MSKFLQCEGSYNKLSRHAINRHGTNQRRQQCQCKSTGGSSKVIVPQVPVPVPEVALMNPPMSEAILLTFLPK